MRASVRKFLSVLGLVTLACSSGELTAPDPIVATDASWVGPGHCSVVDAAGGETAIVYHAWEPGCVNMAGCGREVLVDLVHWDADGWPSVPLAPSATTRPLP